MPAEADQWDPLAGSDRGPGRDLPAEYGPWQTVYGLFRRWQRGGVWSSVLTRLQARADAVGLITWEVNVDSTICRAHQHAAGARRDGQAQKEPPGGHQSEPDDHGLGRSRGGWTTKIHLACEQGQRPLSLLVTAGQRGDSPQFTAVLEPSGFLVSDWGGPGFVRCGCEATKRIHRARTVPICGSAGSAARSRNLPIRQATVSAGERPVGVLQPSTAKTTRRGTRSSAASTGSSGTGPWPRGSTSSRSASKRPSSSPRSTSGCDLSNVSVPHVILAAIRSVDRGATAAMGAA